MKQIIIEIAKNVFQAASLKKTILASAESCTGGMLSTAITDIPGSSTVFECGFVTYSNLSKTRVLGVKEETLKTFGAVSEEVAAEMAIGTFWTWTSRTSQKPEPPSTASWRAQLGPMPGWLTRTS